VALRLLEIEPAMKALEGVVLELEDCAFPLLVDIEATANLAIAFRRTSFALLVGSVPRKPGMERKDLLGVNAGTFKTQGRAIADYAASDVRVLVVGNPCNTNCLIARSNAPEVPAERWFAMMRLDQNRAQSLLARRAQVFNGQVTNMVVYGNHSLTQFPDYENARILGRPAIDVIGDIDWLKGEFLKTVKGRGAAILEGRVRRAGRVAVRVPGAFGREELGSRPRPTALGFRDSADPGDDQRAARGAGRSGRVAERLKRAPSGAAPRSRQPCRGASGCGCPTAARAGRGKRRRG